MNIWKKSLKIPIIVAVICACFPIFMTVFSDILSKDTFFWYLFLKLSETADYILSLIWVAPTIIGWLVILVIESVTIFIITSLVAFLLLKVFLLIHKPKKKI
jgi:hypothetical protein